MHRRQLRCEGMLANAGCAWMMLRCCGLGRLRAGLQRKVGSCEGRAGGAAVRAGNDVGDDGAALLRSSAPATCTVDL